MGDDSWLVLQGGGSPAWIDVPERSKSTFMELKRRKVHQYVIFKIDDRKEEIIIEKTGAPGESYDDFTASLPADDCRYAVYDLDFVSDDNCRKSKIFFISWFVIFFPSGLCFARHLLEGHVHLISLLNTVFIKLFSA
jgi:hypothetical protein